MSIATETPRGEQTHPDVQSYSDVNRDVLAILSRPGLGWWALFGLASAGVAMFLGSWFWQIYKGIGVSGLNGPVGWGVYITTFVFWVGIAHSGTLISAILFLFRAPWRQSVYRAAEAMKWEMKRMFGLLVMGMVLCSFAAGNAWSAENHHPRNVKYHVVCETSSSILFNLSY